MSLQIHGLCKSFAGKPVLENLSHPLPKRGVVCLLGPSGCGKTTLLRCLAGLLPPDQGYIHGLAGLRVSVVFQENRLLPWYDALENVALPIRGDRKRAMEYLELMELGAAAHQLPAQLSGGMQRRVALARALAYGGDLLLLDEPTAGLDAELSQRIISRLLALWQGKLVLLVTHEREIARRYGDYIYEAAGPPLRQLRQAE